MTADREPGQASGGGAKEVPGRFDGETCHRCRRSVGVVWGAADDLWMKVVGRPGGLLCVPCFSGWRGLLASRSG